MTDSPVDVKALAEQLRADAAQLRKMVEQARFGGDETDVRVKSPELLLADLEEAADALLSAQQEVVTFRVHWLEAEARASRAQEEAVTRRALFAALDTTGTGDAVPANLSEALANIAALEAGIAAGRRAQEEAAGMRVERDRLLEKGLNLIEERNRAESKLADAVGVLERFAETARARRDKPEFLALYKLDNRWVPFEAECEAALAFLTSIKDAGDAR